MPSASFHFPKGFLWGTATAAHQVEGNNSNNQWWDWEQQEGRILQGHKSGLACDWWGGRWKEDLDRAAESGQNAHRLSVEWSRIQPAPDRWDEDALERYRLMLRGLRERGLTAMVTLHHFTNPLWFEEMGGWENDESPVFFEKFVRKTVEALKEYCTLWVTFNEPNGYAGLSYAVGVWPPGKKDFNASFHVTTNMVRAHAAAYRAIHTIQLEARVGIALYYRELACAHPTSPLDRWATRNLHHTLNAIWPRALKYGVLEFPLKRVRVPEAAQTQDYFGFNYYSRYQVAFDLRKAGEMFARQFFPPEADLSGTGFLANEPDGMFSGLKWALQFNVPILVTENGVEDAEDKMRPRYIAQHIHQMWRAVNFNWPVKSYFHWSLVDNFEWERGWTQRFGLWELDLDTQARRKRPSANLYAEICKENGLTSEMVTNYCPEVYDKLFPG
ncbi:MAG: family 1 glycosylhydrolase [Anaerolineales bacterium]|nr:family 1 glycosylhydrolase [Anaerolineales bacterium]